MLLDISDVILALGGSIVILILIIVIVVILVTFALQIGIKAVRGENTKLGPVFITNLIMDILSFGISYGFGLLLPAYGYIGSIIALLLNLFIIKLRHKTTYLGALGALIIYVIMLIIIFVVVGLIFSGFLAAILSIFI